MVKSIETYICITLVFKFTNYQAAGRQCDLKKKEPRNKTYILIRTEFENHFHLLGYIV